MVAHSDAKFEGGITCAVVNKFPSQIVTLYENRVRADVFQCLDNAPLTPEVVRKAEETLHVDVIEKKVSDGEEYAVRGFCDVTLSRKRF